MIPELIAGTCVVAYLGWQYLELRETSARLHALRNNCFVTNEKGHRVRYRDASPERQALAEKG